MVSSEEKLANAMGGKTVRVCDSCITKRARWYCAADNAFLCQFCDTLVHSANPLARSHERVHLKVASTNLSSLEIPTPSWHQGFTKKSRTPRGKNSNKHVSHRTSNPLHLVPEIESDELDTENIDEQLPYQVPVFDPFLGNDVLEDPFHMHGLNGFVLPSDLELAKFAADVQSLLGKSLDEESFDAESLGIADFRLNDLVKVEKEMMGEPFELSFDYDSRVAWEEEDEKVKNEDEKCEIFFDYHVNNYDNIHNTSKKNMKMLKLDYEGIIAAWDDDRSPWTNGDRPELDPNDCWPECIGGCGKMQHCHRGDKGMMKGNSSRLDEGREARVSRYREKRRTRLFSKKIRYEVRKLNAEKRPRMKGRFVKRTSFVA